MPTNDFYDDLSWVKDMRPKISSLSFCMNISDECTSLSFRLPDEGSVDLRRPLLEKKDNSFLIQGKTRIELPYNIKEEMKDRILKVPLPDEEEFKTNIMANIMTNIIATYRDITNVKRAWPYYDMFFDRSILGEGFCPLIAMLPQINSFSIFKEETEESLWIKIDMPGREKVKLTTQGLRASLLMSHERAYEAHTVKREDIQTYFDYDTFFIEGKTKTDHYITGIHLPEGIHKKRDMIKKQMRKGVFYAFLPRVKK